MLEKQVIENITAKLIVFGFTEDEIKEHIDSFTEDDIKEHIDFFNETALKKRNETWLKKLVSAHQLKANKEMFVAAGLGHFTEDHNVLDMLKSEGFSVKRYSAKCVAEESH